MNKIGFFWQTSNNPACVEVLSKQLRKVYPNAPIALWEDITDTSAYIAEKYNIDYRTVYRLPGEPGHIKSRPVSKITDGLQYLHRLYISCMTTLKDVEWVIHYEDDVWISREIERFPSTDWAGAHAWQYDNPNLRKYLEEKLELTSRELLHGAAGGAIIKRQSIVDSYLASYKIDWNTTTSLAPEHQWYSDSHISYMLNNNKVIWDSWDQWTQGGYEDFKVYKEPVIHNLKYWYGKTLEQLEQVNSTPEVAFFLENHS